VTTLLGVAAVGAAAYVYRRAQQVAEQEGRPFGEVLREMPGRLVSDFESIGDDFRSATDDGRQAAQDREDEIDEELRQAYGQPPPPDDQPPAPDEPPVDDAQ
jgi:hypothetical protein